MTAYVSHRDTSSSQERAGIADLGKKPSEPLCSESRKSIVIGLPRLTDHTLGVITLSYDVVARFLSHWISRGCRSGAVENAFFWNRHPSC